MTIAVLALGALAVWSSIVTQNGASGLSRAGVQTSGHLRAMQAMSLIDTSTDDLDGGANLSALRKLRNAQAVLDDALDRMDNGDVREATQIADRSKPLVQRLTPAIEAFIAAPLGQDNPDNAVEERMDSLITELQVVLNNLDADPSRLLATELETVTATEKLVRATAIVLIPLGLGGVAACAWLLGVYRRRAEATMLAALDTTAEEARTDELTELPNRRALLEEFEMRSAGTESFTLTLADLNGFKRYNDTFGHPAGDALLRRLGRKLAAACEGHGLAARLGGDEFCALLDGKLSADEAHALLHEALADEGEGFSITSSSGVVAVPEEARTSSEALRLADSRMYAAKMNAHPIADEGLSGALTQMLNERHPGLGNHVEKVASLARGCAEALGLSADDVRTVERAAELHDLGKVGIPSEILTKRGPLNDEEWEFVRRHTLIGERIVGGVPSLERLAPLVRSSHERWDGRGYPDGLAGEAIPLGARIVFVADVYCAMTEERPYAEARSAESARRELSDCAGGQFDPAVVKAFLRVLDTRDAKALAPAPPALRLRPLGGTTG